MYKVNVLHPNPNAEFSLTVSAKSLGHARAAAYRRIQDRFGAATLYLTGDIRKGV